MLNVRPKDWQTFLSNVILRIDHGHQPCLDDRERIGQDLINIPAVILAASFIESGFPCAIMSAKRIGIDDAPHGPTADEAAPKTDANPAFKKGVFARAFLSIPGSEGMTLP